MHHHAVGTEKAIAVEHEVDGACRRCRRGGRYVDAAGKSAYPPVEVEIAADWPDDEVDGVILRSFFAHRDQFSDWHMTLCFADDQECRDMQHLAHGHETRPSFLALQRQQEQAELLAAPQCHQEIGTAVECHGCVPHGPKLFGQQHCLYSVATHERDGFQFRQLVHCQFPLLRNCRSSHDGARLAAPDSSTVPEGIADGLNLHFSMHREKVGTRQLWVLFGQTLRLVQLGLHVCEESPA